MQRNTFIQKVAGIMLAAFFVAISFANAVPQASDDFVTVVHRNGETKVKKNAERVVIFDVGSLETYHELGIPVVGVTNSVPAYLAEYKSDKYTKIGSVMAPDFDAVRALKPDLIIISGRQGSAYDELSEIAPTVFLGVDTDNYWNSFEANVRNIAKIHGKEALAEQKLVKLREQRDLVRAKSADDERKGLVVLHVRGGHSAYGEHSRFGFIHDELGIRQAAAVDATTHTGYRVPEGFVKQVNPDYIFVIDRDSAVGGEPKSTDELLSAEMKQTPAYQNKKIVTLPGNIWYISGGGLISVSKQITDVGEQLYGLTF